MLANSIAEKWRKWASTVVQALCQRPTRVQPGWLLTGPYIPKGGRTGAEIRSIFTRNPPSPCVFLSHIAIDRSFTAVRCVGRVKSWVVAIC